VIDLQREILRVLANSPTTLPRITGALSVPSRREDVALVVAQLMDQGLVELYEDRHRMRYRLTRVSRA
jgi:hypothetical protein